MFDLTGKVFIVTGVTSGLGYAAAKALVDSAVAKYGRLDGAVNNADNGQSTMLL